MKILYHPPVRLTVRTPPACLNLKLHARGVRNGLHPDAFQVITIGVVMALDINSPDFSRHCRNIDEP